MLKRAEVGRLAAAAAEAYAALARAQAEEVEMHSELDKYTAAQSRMLRQELDALDAFDDVPVGAELDMWFGEGLPEGSDSWTALLSNSGQVQESHA